MSNIEFDKLITEIFQELKKEYNLDLKREYLFALRMHSRRFASDYAELKYGILFEYEGLQVKGAKSRHTTVDGYSTDCTKYNLGTSMGFVWLRYTRNHLDKTQIMNDIINTIGARQYSVGKERCSNCSDKLFMPVSILSDNICLLCEYNHDQAKKKKTKTSDAKSKKKPPLKDPKEKKTRREVQRRTLTKQEELIRKVIEKKNFDLIDGFFYDVPKDI